MDKEIWKPIKSFSHYEISSYGRVKSYWNTCWLRPIKILSPSSDRYGYRQVTLCEHSKRFQRLVCHLVLEAFVGTCPKDYEANHKDGIKTNDHLTNLEWISRGKNQIHAFALGLRICKGEANPYAKLSNRDVLKIRSLAKQGFMQKQISKMFCIAESCVSNIVNCKTWTHI